jgi:hypothetical protein
MLAPRGHASRIDRRLTRARENASLGASCSSMFWTADVLTLRGQMTAPLNRR